MIGLIEHYQNNFVSPLKKFSFNKRCKTSFFSIVFFFSVSTSSLFAQWDIISGQNEGSSSSDQYLKNISTILDSFHIRSLKISFSNPLVIYATGSNGIHKSTDGGESWNHFEAIKVGLDLEIDPTSPDIVFVLQPTQLDDTNLWRTTDGGKNWEIIRSAMGIDWLVFDPQNTNIIYSNSYDSGLVKSSNRGDTWGQLKVPAEPVSFLISKINSSIQYSGTKKDGIFKTIDGGLNWNYLGFASDNYNRVLLYFAPENENIIYASIMGKGVFKTNDGGEHWVAKNVGLVDTVIGAIIPDPKLLNRVFLNTLSGLYVSTNGGDEWHQFRPEDQPNPLYPLCLDTTGTGRIFTVRENENGVYVLDSIYSEISLVEENNSPQKFELFQNYPNPFNPVTTITYQIPKSGYVTLKIFDILGNLVKTLVNEPKVKGKYIVQFSAKGSLASGMYLYQIRANDYVSTKKMLLLK